MTNPRLSLHLPKFGVSLLMAGLMGTTLSVGLLAAPSAFANPAVCADLLNSRIVDMAFHQVDGGKTLRLDWDKHADSLGYKLKKLGVDVNQVHFRVVKNGIAEPGLLDWKTRTFDLPMPKVQTDFYLEMVYGGETFYRSYVMIKEDLLGGQTLKPSSFEGMLKNTPLEVKLSDAVKAKGFSGKLVDVALVEGTRKISYVLRQNADSRVRQLLEESEGNVEVEVQFDAKGQPTGVLLSDKVSGKTLMTAKPADFYFKLDAAFSGNSFFWDDMFVSLSTISNHPWLVKSTIEFWLDVQAANGGVIPREVRKGNLRSLFFPQVIELLDPSKQKMVNGKLTISETKDNLTYTNPYLIDWAAEELYTHNPSAENLALLKRVSSSIDDYSKWMYEHRSVRNAKGEWMGFSTNSLASGLDNSRGERGNNFAADSYQSAWVDVLAQQISMFKSSAEWNARFAADKSITPAQRAVYLAKAKEMGNKAALLDAHMLKYHWNWDLGFCFDLIPDGHGGFVQDTKYHSIAGFWAVYSRSLPPRELARMIKMQMTPEHFGGAFPLPANSRHTLVGTDPHEDGYWDIRGHWPSMAAVVIEGFRRSGQTKLASELAIRFAKGMEEASPGSVAEFYGEYLDDQGAMHARVGVHGHHKTRLAFAGWGKLVIYFATRHIVGIQPQADGSLRWDAQNLPAVGSEIGVNNYELHGEKIKLSLRCDSSGKYSIMSSSSTPLNVNVIINGKTVNVQSSHKWTPLTS